MCIISIFNEQCCCANNIARFVNKHVVETTTIVDATKETFVGTSKIVDRTTESDSLLQRNKFVWIVYIIFFSVLFNSHKPCT